MTETAPQRERLEALEAAVRERAGAERHQPSQRSDKRERPETVRSKSVDRPRPLEFDGNGFPVAQRSPSFVTRVARLLSP
jgi:hypothetical protein